MGYQATNDEYFDKVINYKLYKHSIFEKNAKWNQSIAVDYFNADLKNYRFQRTLKASLPFCVPLVVGTAMVAIGGVNSILDPKAFEFFKQGVDLINNTSISLIVPGTVAAISLGVTIYDKILKAKEKRKKQAESIQALIEDLKSGKSDDSVVDASWFYRKSDLSKNSKKINMQLLLALANYREAILEKRNGNNAIDMDKEEEKMIRCFETILQKKGCSSDLKESKYLRSRIDNFYAKKQSDRDSEESQKTANSARVARIVRRDGNILYLNQPSGPKVEPANETYYYTR